MKIEFRSALRGARVWPAAALLAALATVALAHAASGAGDRDGDGDDGHQRRVSSTFTLSASPAREYITAGGTVVYQVRIRRQRFPELVALQVSGLPRGARARWRPQLTRRSGSTLTITTSPGTTRGTYRLRLRARSGRRTVSTSVLLITARPGSGTVSVGHAPFTIAGALAGPLELGTPQALDLRVTNPNRLALRVSSLTVAIARISAPAASTTLPCTTADFAIQQYGGSLSLVIPGRATLDLQALRVPSAGWPQVSIIDRPTNQDGCQGASLTLAYRGTGKLG